MILLTLGGCLDRLLESPYVLAAGFGEARSLAISREGDLVVAGSAGIIRIGADGTLHPLAPNATDAVAVSPTHLFALREGVLDYEGQALPAPAAVDVAATWYSDTWVLYPDRIDAWSLDLERRAVAEGFQGARAVNLGPEGEMLVTFPTEVRAYTAEGRFRVVIAGLEAARVAATDDWGRVYLIQGAEPQLYRLDDGALTLIARFLDAPTDLQFGRGPTLAHTFAYMATGSGRVDYVQVPL